MVSPTIGVISVGLLCYIWHRWRAPSRKGKIQNGVWDPTAGTHFWPHYHGHHACYERHNPDEPPLPIRHLPSLGESKLTEERKKSFSQPVFEEKQILVKRVSVLPHQASTLQRVNSVASSLADSARPESDILPFGGRKSSIGSGSLGLTVEEVSESVVGVGERRPSVMSAGEALLGESSTLRIRRVSAGGEEDMIKIRGASVSSTSPHDSRFRLPVIEEVDTPLPSSKQFPPTMDSTPTSLLQPVIQVPIPPASPEIPPEIIRKPSKRPDSLQIHHSNLPSSQNSTATPITAEDKAGVFQAWRGFSSKPQEIPLPPVPSIITIDPKKLSPRSGTKEGFDKGLWLTVDSEYEKRSLMLSVTSFGAGEKRLSTGKITYLAEVVKEKEISPVPPVIPVPDRVRSPTVLVE